MKSFNISPADCITSSALHGAHAILKGNGTYENMTSSLQEYEENFVLMRKRFEKAKQLKLLVSVNNLWAFRRSVTDISIYSMSAGSSWIVFQAASKTSRFIALIRVIRIKAHWATSQFITAF